MRAGTQTPPPALQPDPCTHVAGPCRKHRTWQRAEQRRTRAQRAGGGQAARPSPDFPPYPPRTPLTFSSSGHCDVSSWATRDSGLMRNSSVCWMSCGHSKGSAG